jgi:hypothetical protein
MNPSNNSRASSSPKLRQHAGPVVKKNHAEAVCHGHSYVCRTSQAMGTGMRSQSMSFPSA